MLTLAFLGGASVSCVLVLALLVKRHMRQFENVDSADVNRFLEMLLKRGIDGSFMILEDMQSKRFLQFRKYRRSGKEIGLECHFPRAPWSSDVYKLLRNDLIKQEISFGDVTGAGDPVDMFLRIDFGRDVSSATRFAEHVFTKLFGLPDVKVRVRSHGISPGDEIVNREG